MFRRSFCVTWRWHSVRVASETAEHLGAEDDTDSGQGQVDVGVRVLLRMRGQSWLQLGDLSIGGSR